MKAPAFDYIAPRSLGGALDALAERSDARVLAGGQSLTAALNFRMAAVDCLVDINRIQEFCPIERRRDCIALGALVRHAEAARSELIAACAPLVSEAMRHVAHPAVRNRGTTCGSLAHADPAAEMPACAVALNATLVLKSRGGERQIAARDFYLGIYETARKDDEILTEVRFPVRQDDEIFGFDEITRRHGDFALVGAAARARSVGGAIRDLDLVIFASEPQPLLSERARAIAEGRAWSDDIIVEIAEAVSEEMDPMDNSQGRPDTKRRQARALTARILKDMRERSLARR